MSGRPLPRSSLETERVIPRRLTSPVVGSSTQESSKMHDNSSQSSTDHLSDERAYLSSRKPEWEKFAARAIVCPVAAVCDRREQIDSAVPTE